MTRYINHAETNKLIRSTLKAEFPNVKFSVKKHGGSTYVTYEAPILKKDIESVVKFFEGRTFDGMQDLAMPKFVQTDGEKISYGANYIFVKRIIPIDEQVKFADYLVSKFAWKDSQGKSLDEHPGYEIKTSSYSGSQYIECDRSIYHGNIGSGLDYMVNKYAQENVSFAAWMDKIDAECRKWATMAAFDNALEEAVEKQNKEPVIGSRKADEGNEPVATCEMSSTMKIELLAAKVKLYQEMLEMQKTLISELFDEIKELKAS